MVLSNAGSSARARSSIVPTAGRPVPHKSSVKLADSVAARGGGDEGVAEDWCGTCPLPLVLKLFGCPGQKEKDNNSARSADKSVCSTQARDTGILLSYLWET